MRSTWQDPVCVLLILLGSSLVTNGQTNVAKFQFGLSAGTFIYQGDLTPSPVGSYRTLHPLVNLFASKLISSSFALRGNFVIGSLGGNDAAYNEPAYRQHRNFNFHSPVIEMSGIAEWNLLGRNYVGRGFSPYVFAGIGFSVVRIKRDYSHLDTEYFPVSSELLTGLPVDLQHPLPRTLLVAPVGAGIRYYFSDRVGISAETSYRIMSNDYLDGFSRAVNPARGDHYYSHTIGVVYRLGKKNTLACPEKF
jgi:hypothetical protein